MIEERKINIEIKENNKIEDDLFLEFDIHKIIDNENFDEFNKKNPHYIILKNTYNI